jgi:translation initiation factor 5A
MIPAGRWHRPSIESSASFPIGKVFKCPDFIDGTEVIAMATEQAEVRELKEGRYMVIDNEPCKIMSISTSKPGKHGEAKARIEAMGIFDGNKKSVVYPVKHKVQVPIIDKRTAQIVSIMGAEVQLMDLETYEMFHLPITDDVKDDLKPGGEILYLVAMDRKKITRV